MAACYMLCGIILVINFKSVLECCYVANTEKNLSIHFLLEANVKKGLQSFVIGFVYTATPILLLFTWFPQRLNEFLQILDRYDSKYVFSGKARHAKFSCVLILRLHLDYLPIRKGGFREEIM